MCGMWRVTELRCLVLDIIGAMAEKYRRVTLGAELPSPFHICQGAHGMSTGIGWLWGFSVTLCRVARGAHHWASAISLL